MAGFPLLRAYRRSGKDAASLSPLKPKPQAGNTAVIDLSRLAGLFVSSLKLASAGLFNDDLNLLLIMIFKGPFIVM